MAAPKPPSEDKCKLYDRSTVLPAGLSHTWIWKGNVKVLLERLPERELVDLVVTSPPYNMGKVYENKRKHKEYIRWQGEVIDSCVARLKSSGSICWQVGNIVKGVGRKSEILPLDIGLHEHFVRNEMKLRNRIVWHYGHGFHCKHRFSGRYEVIMWYTKSDSYHFDLDPVRVAAKYPGKKHYRGPKAGEYSCNPLGKNPEDSWDFLEEDFWELPNVKSKHVEKTVHPCQFPIGLVERLVLALSPKNGRVFDPFLGTGSSAIAAVRHGRHGWGAELSPQYARLAKQRIEDAFQGTLRTRSPFDPPMDPHLAGKVARIPQDRQMPEGRVAP